MGRLLAALHPHHLKYANVVHAVLGDGFGNVVVRMIEKNENVGQLILQAHEKLLAAGVRLLGMSLLPACE